MPSTPSFHINCQLSKLYQNITHSLTKEVWKSFSFLFMFVFWHNFGKSCNQIWKQIVESSLCFELNKLARNEIQSAYFGREFCQNSIFQTCILNGTSFSRKWNSNRVFLVCRCQKCFYKKNVKKDKFEKGNSNLIFWECTFGLNQCHRVLLLNIDEVINIIILE